MDTSMVDPGLLKKTISEFNGVWIQASTNWHDKQKIYFERIYVDPINRSCRSTLKAWEDLVEIIKQAEEQILNQE